MPEPQIEVRGLTMAYGDFVVQRDLNFTVSPGRILVIMGPSGCGKSTLMKHMIGLEKPAAGQVLYRGTSLHDLSEGQLQALQRRFGVAYQAGALWSSLTIFENVALPLQEYTGLRPRQIQAQVEYKLGLVGLRGFEGFYPAQISGGMRKRAALARALALDPEVLFFDEPSAGLDPVTSRRLDDTVLRLRDSLGTTVVVVSHELASIFTIADEAVYLDAEERTLTALGPPEELRRHPPTEAVRRFLNRETA